MKERNFHNFLREKTKENGSRLLFQKKDGWSWKQITWPDLATEVESIACFLLNSGFSTGSRIIVLSPNTLSCLFFELAVFSLGGTSLPARSIKEARNILEISAGDCFLLCASTDDARELVGDPMLGEKVEKAFLSVNDRVPVEEEIVSYPSVVKFGFLARKKLKDEISALGSSIKEDSEAVIFNAEGGLAENRSFSHGDILDLLCLSEQELGAVSVEDQTFSYLPSSGSFSKFANLLSLQTATRGAIAEDTQDFFADVPEIMPVMLFLAGAEIENVVNRLGGENGSGENLRNALGGRLRLLLTDVPPPERTRDLLLAQNISVVELKSLSVVP
ncbi:MAG: AMP-binding protein [Candidatus Dadabacteria bacterium]|nr:AMP-binding protein [Candidatus Dadabacteria bacterium]